MNPITAYIAAKSRSTVWVDPMNVSGRLHGSFNPEAELELFTANEATSYDARYGAGAHAQKGNVVGERYNLLRLGEEIDAGHLDGVPVGYRPTRAEEEDLKLVAYPPGSKTAIYDTIVVSVAPGPVDPPPPPPPVDPVPPALPPTAHIITLSPLALRAIQHLAAKDWVVLELHRPALTALGSEMKGVTQFIKL